MLARIDNSLYFTLYNFARNNLEVTYVLGLVYPIKKNVDEVQNQGLTYCFVAVSKSLYKTLKTHL